MKLETERLILRPYEHGDLQDYFRLLSDCGNMYFLDDIKTETVEAARESLAEAIALFQTGGARRFAVLQKGQQEIIGGVGYDITAKTPLGCVGHMGWFLAPEFQNRGIITEAARRVLEYAFQADGCIRITTGCYAENLPTQRVIAKLNFRLEAHKIGAAFHDGKMKDRLEFAINKNEVAYA